MPVDPAIRAALNAAWQAECVTRARVNECEPMSCTRACPCCAAGSVASIVAFLRALPAHHMRRKLGQNRYDVDGTTTKRLAVAVEEAARDEQRRQVSA
jgi:hypothetical protein